MTGEYIICERDLDFLLYEWLEVESLLERPLYADHNRETCDAVLALCRRLAMDQFAPHNRAGDTDEPRIVDGRVVLRPEIKTALQAYAASGLIAASLSYEAGGMQLPVVVEKAGLSWLRAANIATSAYSMLTAANLRTLLKHGTPEQISRFSPLLLDGRATGTMCLSEPQAGSSLADIATRAIPQPDGSYRLFGNKTWISGGDHELTENIVHLVLARVPGAPAGTRGLSLFIVPKFLVGPDCQIGERNDIALVSLNHKMGYHATTNCVLNLGEGLYRPGGAAGAIGYRIGAENGGLACMFHMMNEARINVGLGATALGYTGYLHALVYARTHHQGRLPSHEDPESPQVPIIRHADVRRMLLAQKAYVEGALALTLYCARLVDEERSAETELERRKATLLLGILTPVAKSWPAQWCLIANDLAIQVHGGAGYTRDFPVEQFYRDNRLNPIHEGTHGIQGLDLLRRKIFRDNGEALDCLAETIRVTIKRGRDAADGNVRDAALQLDNSLHAIRETVDHLLAESSADKRLANASLFLEAFGHMIVGWMWFEQMLACTGREGPFYEGKRRAGLFFFRYEMPRIAVLLGPVASVDTTALEMDETWF